MCSRRIVCCQKPSEATLSLFAQQVLMAKSWQAATIAASCPVPIRQKNFNFLTFHILQSVSIIVTCQDQRQELMCLLPELLSNGYDGKFEVIVVDKIHDKDMAEWLEEMEVHYANLSHTFCSSTVRGIDVHKLALTLGAKASNYDWLAIMPANTVLPAGDWLSHYLANCSEGVDIVIDAKDRGSLWKRFKSFFFRRKFSIFYPRHSILLCRRSIVLQPTPNIPKKRIIRLSL